MANLGTVVVIGVKQQDADHFKLTCQYAGHDGTNACEDGFDLDGISPGISTAALEAAIKAECKTRLIADHGFSFGMLDTVRMVGATL